MDHRRSDILIIGAGIAGASAAYECAHGASVIVLDMEDQPGAHATGRSAAFFTELYGNATMRGLTSASRAFFEEPPSDFCTETLLSQRGVLYVARDDQIQSLERFYQEVRPTGLVERQDGAFARRTSPLLAPDYVSACVWEPGACEIDVHALLTGYLRGARKLGAKLQLSARVNSLRRGAGVWRVEAGDTVFEADIVINAAGAWAELVGHMAGCSRITLTPKRRTMCTIPLPPGQDDLGRCVVIDVDEQFYFKPESRQILLSPADQRPVEPCDAYAEDMDVAVAVDRFERATGRVVQRVSRSWAGLRTFAPDMTVVIGFDPDVESFFWLAGQGGYGIQTAPAAAHCAAALVAGGELPAEIRRRGVTADAISPARFVARAGQ